MIASDPPEDLHIRDSGAILHGSAHSPSAHVPAPKQSADKTLRVWLWVEGWDGQSHQASLALTERWEIEP